MRIIDSHFHWYPRPVFDELCKSTGYPRAERNGNGYRYWRRNSAVPQLSPWPEWFDLDHQLAAMDKLGHQVDVITSSGPFSIYFSELEPQAGRAAAQQWNEEMGSAQRKLPNRVWATAVVPLVDTKIALEILDEAILKHKLVGVNVPGSIGLDPNIDAERLEPFYARVEELGVPILLHPTDAVFEASLEGYGGALSQTLGRVMEVSAAAMRLVLSGMMERHANLKVIMSHTGGALPYQSGRMDKNSSGAKLPQKTSNYLKRMYTDTVSPHSDGMKFGIHYYGADHVMYGSDYPCWDPAVALKLLDEVGLSPDDMEKVLRGNAVRVFGLQQRQAQQAA